MKSAAPGLILLVIFVGWSTACYDADCQASLGSCVSCACPSGGGCGWTGGGCICAYSKPLGAQPHQVLYTTYGHDRTCTGAQSTDIFYLNRCNDDPLGGSASLQLDPATHLLHECRFSEKLCKNSLSVQPVCGLKALDTCYAYGNGPAVYGSMQYSLIKE